MLLLSLPNELLWRIAQYLEYADEVSAYSQACRLFHSLASPLLFRHVHQRQVEAIKQALHSGDHMFLKRLLVEAELSTEIFSVETERDPLNVAAEWGHIGLVQVLLDLGQFDLNCTDFDFELPIVSALLNGHLDIARLLISRGADPNFAEREDVLHEVAAARKPLYYAVRTGPFESVRFLVEEAAVDLDPRDSNGWTPLFFAASRGHLDEVKLLLSAGADPRVKDSKDKTILFHAVQGGNKETVEFLLEIPGHSDYFLKELDGAALAHITSQGETQAAYLLLERIDLHARIKFAPVSDFGDYLAPYLFSYAACGQEDSVRLLLEKGCDPLAQVVVQDSKFDQFDNPLKQAASNGHTNVVSMLLHSIRAQNHSQLEPSVMMVIHIASERNELQLLLFMLDSEMFKQLDLDPKALETCLSEALFLAACHEAPTRVLLDHGAKADRQGVRDFQMLAKAVEDGTPATVRMLLNHDRGRRTLYDLLETAQKHRNLDMVKLLLEKLDNVDCSPSDELCQSALVNAVSCKLVENINYFLDRGLDVNGICPLERPLLVVAVLSINYNDLGPDPVVLLLLDRGAAVDAVDDFQRTALWHAVENSNIATVQTLLDHGADPLHEDREGQSPLHVAARHHRTNTLMRTILRSLEATKIIKGDLMHIATQERDVPDQQEDKCLKYLKQHHYRMMYPCP